VPDSYGKRQRSQVKARKAAAREERRLDRNRRQADRAAGLSPDEGTPPEEGEQSLGAEPEATPADEPKETPEEG
jgi:hypothetical protein